MTLLDTLDSSLMLTLYTSPALSADPISILYYNIVLTAITILVALVIGILQLLMLAANLVNPDGDASGFWGGVEGVGDRWDVIGKFHKVISVSLNDVWNSVLSLGLDTNSNDIYLICWLDLGACICASFSVLGALSVVLHNPWRRWVSKQSRDIEVMHHSEETQPKLELCPNSKTATATCLVELDQDGKTVEEHTALGQDSARKKGEHVNLITTVS